MKLVLISILLLYVTSTYCIKWEDCGIPLTRKIYYQSIVVSPSAITIDSKTSDRSISVNVNANLQNYAVDSNVQVKLQIIKDGDTFLDVLVGALCTILENQNQVTCPLQAGSYSFSYLYVLPPLPTGNFSVKIVTYEEISGKEIGCLLVQAPITGLGADSCTYTSAISAELVGTATYGTNTIQIGPWGPNGEDLTFNWGTFKNVDASSDLVGYSGVVNLANYVWGITGKINTTVSGNLFQGTFVIGYRPVVTDNANAQLIHQGTFSWFMNKQTGSPPYIFQSGSFVLTPAYYYPTNFPYPLNFGNLGVIVASPSTDGSTIIVKGSKTWCRCNCDGSSASGVGSVHEEDQGSSSSMSRYRAGTIVIGVVGGLFLIVAVIFLVRMSKAPKRPVIYDDNDLMDPQKPDYGTIAINEVFDSEEKDYM